MIKMLSVAMCATIFMGCAAEAAPPKSPAAGAKPAATAAKGTPATSSSATKALELKFSGHTCTLDAPAGFVMQEKDTPAGRVFLFADPSIPQAEMLGMTAAIVPTSTETNQSAFLDGFLSPFKGALKGFKEQPQDPVAISGHQFQSRDFNGNFAQGTPITGFAYVTTINGAHFLLSGTANGPNGARGLLVLRKMAKSFRKPS